MERLLEREAPLEMLAAAVRDAAAGRGSLVLVGGEAGIGKTSLVRALRERVADHVAFLVGACEPLSVPVPLAPLRELAEAAGAGDLTELDGGDRLVLARTLLEALSARAPAVAVIEDAHWADPTTLDVVRLLARRIEHQRIAVLMTYREDEVAANPDLRQLLGDLATNPATRRLALDPLSESAISELAAPSGLDPRRLSQITGGNPFLVVETIAAGHRLPASVRDAALARAGRLSAPARRVIDAAAVIGQRVAPALLEGVAPDSTAAVEEALARGVLVADADVLEFRHELMREAIESSIAPPRRAELHARVLAALEQQPGDSDNARLAHHAERAGRLAEASSYAARAMADAQRIGALREVSLQAERALRLGAGLEPAERFHLLVQRARAMNFVDTRLEEALAPAEEAIALAQEMRDPAREGRALMTLAYPLWSLDRVAEARAAALRAVELLEHTDDVEGLARAQSTLIRMEATAFDPERAIELGARALELADEAGLEETRIDLAISLALARGHRGQGEALDALAEALGAARTAALPIQMIRTYVNLVYIGVALRRHGLVDEITPEALAFCDEYGSTIPRNAMELYRARGLIDRGHFGDALAFVTRTDLDWAAEKLHARAIAALLRARLGDPEDPDVLEEAWKGMRGVPEGSRHVALRVMLVEAAWLKGDQAAAVAQLREARDSPAAHRFARSAGDLAAWAARLGLEFPAPANAPEAVLLEVEGDWRGAIRAWKQLEAPYDAALAALRGGDRAAADALAELKRLGAAGAARAFTRERMALGARAPRGPRRSTLANPAGLTRREQEVLDVLATGATNPAIAAALHLSERTVAHHVSAVLGKLGAPTRLAAVEQARARGLLAQDRHTGSEK
ncbi:MAG TPA: AAA family ATPase [Thermoleophilaceae bacterium]|nr:AAA family ATPase [Thermoleophilaceae bacterium]